MSTSTHLTVPRRPPFWRRHIVSAVAIATCMTGAGVAVAVAAQPNHTTRAASAGPVQSGPVAVSIQDFAFSPSSLTVKVGSVVTWTNVDSEAHTVRTIATDALHSGVLDTSATFTYTFQSPGTYAYHCSIHPEMQATITVVS